MRSIVHGLNDALQHSLTLGLRFYVIGEMHGSRQNIDFLRASWDFFRESQTVTLAFEWPSSWNTSISRHVRGESQISDWTPYLLIDGRFSYDHAAFLDELREYNLSHNVQTSVFCFDPDDWNGDDWSDRDRQMYTNIEPVLISDGVTLLTVGKLHSETKAFLLDDKECIPFGYHLLNDRRVADTVSFIRLQYKGGAIHNMVVRQLPHSDSKALPSHPRIHCDLTLNNTINCTISCSDPVRMK